MLGRLAKWLRLAGYDTLYDAKLDDNELVRRSRLTGRVVLTRDHELASRPRVHSLLVQSDDVQEQMMQVLSAFPLSPDWQDRSRCPEDNAILEDADKYEVEGLVPTYVWVNYERFQRCPKCKRVFWPGTHWQSINRRLSTMVGRVC